ncbi:uncharacterized protein LOC126772738 [Nymphalis io]|uniref:uncharacterized protein LOC126772738 n=1 Tax=Inachis io TaxID=171585 RepID=UPI002167A33F|nr:uncharacterized protein LOC126772738 [Nymphalis io]
MSDPVIDNGSDDDVIEVVRDEAPIEILSDGEEMEIEKSKQANLSLSQPFNFAAPNTPAETTLDEKELSEQEDPLRNNFCETENTFTMTEREKNTVPVITRTTSLEDLFKADDKSNHDSSGENCFINVTDVGNSSVNEAEQLKQKVQQDLSSNSEIDKTLNMNISDVPIDDLLANKMADDSSEKM